MGRVGYGSQFVYLSVCLCVCVLLHFRMLGATFYTNDDHAFVQKSEEAVASSASMVVTPLEVVDECCVVYPWCMWEGALHSVVGDVFTVVIINLCCTDKAKIHVYVGGQKGCLHFSH